MSEVALENHPQNKPLWEVHIVKYPTSNAAGNMVFKLHHALGDGYSLMGALLSCLQRADDPSLPLTFPSSQRSSSKTTGGRGGQKGIFSLVAGFYSSVCNTMRDVMSWSLLKSSLVGDDKTPIRSGNEGTQFLPTSITTVTFSLDQMRSIKDKLGVVRT